MSALAAFSASPGHLSWPLFTPVGFSAGVESGLLDSALRPLGWLGVLGFGALAILHVVFALRGLDSFSFPTVPTDRNGEPLFRPSKPVTLLVAAVLAGMAYVPWSQLTGGPSWTRWLALGGVAALVLRMIGDGTYLGFLKSRRASRFAVLDDTVFTPIVVLLTFTLVSAIASG